MLHARDIEGLVLKKLSAHGLKPEVTHVARFVIESIVEHINAEFFAVEKRQCDAVEATKSGRMKRPSIEQVIAHGASIELADTECRRFFDHYESNGWKVGRNPMRLWTAAMANWKRNNVEKANGHVNGTAKLILNQTALRRVEERIKDIRAQMPMPANDPMRAELAGLKGERMKLLETLNLKC